MFNIVNRSVILFIRILFLHFSFEKSCWSLILHNFVFQQQTVSRLYLPDALLVWNGIATSGADKIQQFLSQLPPTSHTIMSIDSQRIQGTSIWIHDKHTFSRNYQALKFPPRRSNGYWLSYFWFSVYFVWYNKAIQKIWG